MSLPVPDRISWAVEHIGVQPADRLLEIGCGAGVAAGLVCDRLTTGHLLAVDRSAAAVRRAGTRNAEHIAAGRLTVRQQALADLELPPESLDLVFAMNVNVFWTSAATRELAVVRAALRPSGAVHLLWDAAGPTGADRVLAAVSGALTTAGFRAVRVTDEPRGIGVSAGR